MFSESRGPLQYNGGSCNYFFMLVYQANFQKNKCTKINLRADTKCNPIFLELSANINQTSRFVMISNAG